MGERVGLLPRGPSLWKMKSYPYFVKVEEKTLVLSLASMNRIGF